MVQAVASFLRRRLYRCRGSDVYGTTSVQCAKIGVEISTDYAFYDTTTAVFPALKPRFHVTRNPYFWSQLTQVLEYGKPDLETLNMQLTTQILVELACV